MAIFEPIKPSNRLMIYNWQQPDWPEFSYQLIDTEETLFAIAEETGHIDGVLRLNVSRLNHLIGSFISQTIYFQSLRYKYKSQLPAEPTVFYS